MAQTANIPNVYSWTPPLYERYLSHPEVADFMENSEFYVMDSFLSPRDMPVLSHFCALCSALKLHFIADALRWFQDRVITKMLCRMMDSTFRQYLESRNPELLFEQWQRIRNWNRIAFGKKYHLEVISGVIVYYAAIRWYFGYPLHPILYCYLWYGRAFNLVHFVFHSVKYNVTLEEQRAEARRRDEEEYGGTANDWNHLMGLHPPTAIHPDDPSNPISNQNLNSMQNGLGVRDVGAPPTNQPNGPGLRRRRPRWRRHRQTDDPGSTVNSVPFVSIFVQIPQSMMVWMGCIWMQRHFEFHREHVLREVNQSLSSVDTTILGLQRMQDIPRAVGQIIVEYAFSERLLEIDREKKVSFALQYEVGLSLRAVNSINECLFDRGDDGMDSLAFEIRHKCGDGKWILGRMGPLRYNGKSVFHRPMTLRISWGNRKVVRFEKATDCLYDMKNQTLQGFEDKLVDPERRFGDDVPGTGGRRSFKMYIDDRDYQSLFP